LDQFIGQQFIVICLTGCATLFSSAFKLFAHKSVDP